MTRILSRAAIAAATLAAFAAPASAHMSFETPTASAGAAYKGVLRLPHGCDGAATDAVRVTIPDGFYGAQPMPKAGWTLETETGAYDKPFDDHGTQLTEGARAITWSGGHVEDGWYDEFVLRGTVGADLAGATLTFAVEQRCGDAVEAWTPAVAVSAATETHDHGHAGHGAAEPEEATVGDLTLSEAFTRATLPNAPTAGGYVTIANGGSDDDRLVSASSPVAGEVQIHEMSVIDDVMQMRELEEGIAIPAGETVALSPGGLHLMFIGLSEGFAEGETVPVTLTFEHAGDVEIALPVRALGAGASDAHGEHAGH